MVLTVKERFMLRKKRVRTGIFGTAKCPRLSVCRSNRGISAQVIDDEKGFTLAAASSLSKDIRDKMKGKVKVEQAKIVGEYLAKCSLAAGVTKVVFDRSGYKYHGRIKSLADAARAGGLKF